MRVWSYHCPPRCQGTKLCYLQLYSIMNWQRESRDNHLPEEQAIGLLEYQEQIVKQDKTKYSDKRLDFFLQKPPVGLKSA